VAKDRARPFSRKHRKYWLTITGGMVLIGLVDLVLGFSFWPHRGDEGPPQPIRYSVRQVPGELAHLHPVDAGAPSDAAPPAPAPTATPR
jgi:hypothetical protein